MAVLMARLAGVATEMSAVPLLEGSPSIRWSKARDRPSGAQSNAPTVNAPVVTRLAVFVARSTVHRWVCRWSSSTTSKSPYCFSRRFIASDFGSSAVYASLDPSGDHANDPDTPSSAVVMASASPPARRMT